MEFVYNMDYAVLNFLQDHLRCGFLDGFFRFVTGFGAGGIFWMALAALFLCFRRTRKMGLCMGIALALGALSANLLLKPLVARVRPYENPEYLHLIRVTRDELISRVPPDFSFPSGHALSSVECGLSIFFQNRKLGVPALILGFLVAFSRLYLYMHYFTDVLASAVLGAGFAVAAFFLGGWIARKFVFLKAENP